MGVKDGLRIAYSNHLVVRFSVIYWMYLSNRPQISHLYVKAMYLGAVEGVEWESDEVVFLSLSLSLADLTLSQRPKISFESIAFTAFSISSLSSVSANENLKNNEIQSTSENRTFELVCSNDRSFGSFFRSNTKLDRFSINRVIKFLIAVSNP